ncbi:hypothetical protein SPO15_003705 [Escherichia coli]|uniref:hypothetical protein n=1 Tax=Escherichia coli TaxID=562 RepID=UPI00174FD6F2|nr:hypothetical protein [Escherichia coli]EFO4091863.1 hypothetical protein [Escherichia coli]EHE2562401.1 hypothetical protein [Escherichia coli]EJN1760808.1 hypothetical protein [Escherichia coli]EJW4400635.1 hypothetical protein [Escherichia coli]ELA5630719.1 hypothetical protein [Escherichia coli]
MDESRKQFEEYVAKKLRLPFEMITEARNGDRYFAFSSVDIRHSLNEWWTLWQASRAAIEIELPVWFVSDAIAVYDRDDIDESIRAAGIKVKE